MTTGVVGLVIVRFMCDGHGIEPGGYGLMITQAGSGRHGVKDLDHPGPEAPGELPIP
jgi:hypothetical protein